MPETTVNVDRLVVHVNDVRRAVSPEPGIDVVEVDLEIENPIGSPGTGSTMWLPPIELQDDGGNAYDAEPDDNLASEMDPDTRIAGTVQFHVPAEAGDFTLVFGAGEDWEREVALGG